MTTRRRRRRFRIWRNRCAREQALRSRRCDGDAYFHSWTLSAWEVRDLLDDGWAPGLDREGSTGIVSRGAVASFTAEAIERAHREEAARG